MSAVSFTIIGSGEPVILLHGFPLNSSMWTDFAQQLSKNYAVYLPDLPGFGKSDPLSENFTLKQVANTLLAWMDDEQIPRSIVIGHSLGGYIALHMAAEKPEKFSGLGLFLSTAVADSIEKKESRTKVIEFIHKNGVEAFTTNFIEPLFADHNNISISSVKKVAGEASAQAVIGYTRAMRDRENQESVLKSFADPILFIAGEHDKGIPVGTIKSQAQLCQHPELHILTQSAHMGMFEELKWTSKIVGVFVSRCLRLANS